MFVAPGPDVAKHTPGLRLTRPNPSAMCAADCSCRTRMWRMSDLNSSSYMGRLAPPGRPNTCLTPSLDMALMRAAAPIIVCSSMAWLTPPCQPSGNLSVAGAGRPRPRPCRARASGGRRDPGAGRAAAPAPGSGRGGRGVGGGEAAPHCVATAGGRAWRDRYGCAQLPRRCSRGRGACS